MAIMVAGGVTFAVPGIAPAQAVVSSSNPNLFVSVEGQSSGNEFSEHTIVEVLIIDDDQEGLPEVEINGDALTMVASDNGNWYGYFVGGGNAPTRAGITYEGAGADTTNDILEDSPLLRNPHTDTNNNDIDDIQTFDFGDESTVTVSYLRAGGEQSVDLVYDNPDESVTADREEYAGDVQVFLTLEDLELNIDPTSADVWTFVETGAGYQTWYRSAGDADAALATTGPNDIEDTSDDREFSIDDINNLLVCNEASTMVEANTCATGFQITVVETQRNSSIFENTNTDNEATLMLISDPTDNRVFDVNYEDENVRPITGSTDTVLVIDDSGIGDAWTSGESVSVTLTDADLNTNSRTAQTLEGMDAPTITITEEVNGQDTDITYTLHMEESSANSGVFTGTMEYIRINGYSTDSTTDDYGQINLATTNLREDDSDEIVLVLRDVDEVQIDYSDGDDTVTDSLDAPTFTGRISFDQEDYSVGGEATITITDGDLNIASDVRDLYQTPAGGSLLTLEVDNTCGTDFLFGQDFTLVETGDDTGIFKGTFDIPDGICLSDGSVSESVSPSGESMTVTYRDTTDASGTGIDAKASASIRSVTGTVSLDSSVYPVPFGTATYTDNEASQFPVHQTARSGDNRATDDTLQNGDVIVTITVTDADYDDSASGVDSIDDGTPFIPAVAYVPAVAADPNAVPPVAAVPEVPAAPAVPADERVTITIQRGGDRHIVGYAGGADADLTLTPPQFGPIGEDDPGVFTIDIPISYDAGPQSNKCPGNDTCVLQGDVLHVQYTDVNDASGDINTTTDSATFDLRNGSLQTDRPAYIIGSDMLVTLLDPDLNLDSSSRDSVSLDVVEWASNQVTTTLSNPAFDAQPSQFQETGDSTGVFQVTLTMPSEIDDRSLERNEEIDLEYTDWGPSGADYVGDKGEDIRATIYTSNFGATIELDQRVYTWTDKVFIKVVSPDHNFDSAQLDEIGNDVDNPIRVATRTADLDRYKLVETGTSTGIFVGEVILTGFEYDANNDSNTNDISPTTSGNGPSDGMLEASNEDGITVTFEYSNDATVQASSLIRWNIGEIQWLEASYPATGSGIVRVIDRDMNLNPETADSFDVRVWSDTTISGVDLSMTETHDATGIFEGTVFFALDGLTSGHRLKVSEGDTITAQYVDATLPAPDQRGDTLRLLATTLIGTIVPPLERAPISDLKIVDSAGNALDVVSVDRQIVIEADLTNGQDKEQPFVYLVQIQDSDGVTVSLDWTRGDLAPGQSLSSGSSWAPSEAGTYTVTAFVWESVNNPTALSPPATIDINVN